MCVCVYVCVCIKNYKPKTRCFGVSKKHIFISRKYFSSNLLKQQNNQIYLWEIKICFLFNIYIYIYIYNIYKNNIYIIYIWYIWYIYIYIYIFTLSCRLLSFCLSCTYMFRVFTCLSVHVLLFPLFCFPKRSTDQVCLGYELNVRTIWEEI